MGLLKRKSNRKEKNKITSKSKIEKIYSKFFLNKEEKFMGILDLEHETIKTKEESNREYDNIETISFEENQQPVLMRVDIEGWLKNATVFYDASNGKIPKLKIIMELSTVLLSAMDLVGSDEVTLPIINHIKVMYKGRIEYEEFITTLIERPYYKDAISDLKVHY